MDIHFSDLSEVPLPPDEVRIRDFTVEPYPDGKRLRLMIDLTPFLKPPSSEIFITDQYGELAATANIIEIVDPQLQLTIHLRIPDPQGLFTARVLIFYTQDLDEVTDGDQIIAPPTRQVVDQSECTFSIDP
jgi:hypothetical protein